MTVKNVLVALLMAAAATTAWGEELVAFPGAQGWGRLAKGARASSSPTVYHVTNLNDSGTGSLRDAVSASNRIVVFDVSGVIRISSRIVFSSNLYVAGQTAPGEGITVYGDGVSFSGASNIICRYLRVRMGHGGSSGKDCAGIANGTNMIFDHCSFSWGLDETFSINPDGKGDLHNITLQNSIIGQGLMTHSAGGLMQADSITLYRNLYIDNSTRNNKVKGINQYANNVVYNWSNGCYIMGGDSEGSSYVNIESNCFINGPSGGGNCFGGANEDFHCYGVDNWQDSDKDGQYDPAEVTNYSASDHRTTDPYDYPALELYAGNELIDKNIPTVGASLPYRDQSDCYMIDELMSFGQKGALITYETSLPIGAPDTWSWWSGSKPTDTDGDGMPDAWEDANGTDKATSDATVVAPNGYLNIENYINSIGASDRQFFLRQPITLDLSYATTSTLVLTWRDYTYEEEGFAIEVNTDGTWTEVGRTAAGATTYTVTGLNDGTPYEVRVRAFAQHDGAEVCSDYTTGTFQTRPIEVGILDVDSFEPDVTNATAVDSGAKLLLHSDDVLDYTLSADIKPSAVVATGTGRINVSGSAIGGDSCSVNKAGEGVLSLSNSNTYGGATVLHNGTIEFSTLKNGGVASAIGASRNFAQNWIWDGGTYRYTGASTSTDRSAKLSKSSTLEIAQSGTVVKPTGTFEGTGDLTLDGQGTLQVADASFFGYTGNTVLRGGTLYLSDTEAACKVVGNYVKKFVMAGGTLQFYSKNEDYQTYSFPIEAEDGTRSVIIPATHCYLKNTFTGNGDIEFQIPYLRSQISANFTGFTGKIYAKGTNASGNAIFYHASQWNIPNTRVNLSGTIYMTAWGTNTTNYVGGISGDAGTYLIGSSKNTAKHTCSWIVGSANSDETFNGIINNLPAGLNKAYSGTTSIQKVGTGLWRLNGNNAYAGTTTVTGGTLIVNGKHTDGGSYTVASGATLKGCGTIAQGTITVQDGGTLCAGDTVVANKVFNLSGTTLNLESGSQLTVPLYYSGNTKKSNCYTFGTVNVKSGAVLNLDMSRVSGRIAIDTKFSVFQSASAINGTFSSVEPATPGEGLQWDLSELYTNGCVYVREEGAEQFVWVDSKLMDETGALDGEGYYWFTADNDSLTQQLISQHVITLDESGKASRATTYATDIQTGTLKLSKTAAVVFALPGNCTGFKLALYRASGTDWAQVYASCDSLEWTKLQDITSDKLDLTLKETNYVDLTLDGMSNYEYRYLKVEQANGASPTYLSGVAITYLRKETTDNSPLTLDREPSTLDRGYDLQGRRVPSAPARTIIIKNRKKTVK